MAVVLGAVVAVGGFALTHGDYSDYGDYGDYSDYSDAEAKKEMQINNLKEEAENAAKILSEYKSQSVNPELSSQSLREESAMRVSEAAMDKDVKSSIEKRIDDETLRDTETLQMEMQKIDKLLAKIEKIERGNKDGNV